MDPQGKRNPVKGDLEKNCPKRPEKQRPDHGERTSTSCKPNQEEIPCGRLMQLMAQRGMSEWVITDQVWNRQFMENTSKRNQLFFFLTSMLYRWPVVYFGSNPATVQQLYNTFWKCVDVLDDLNVTVDYIMTDGASFTISCMTLSRFETTLNPAKWKTELALVDTFSSMRSVWYGNTGKNVSNSISRMDFSR